MKKQLLVLMTLFIFSCNNDAGKKDPPKESPDSGVEKKYIYSKLLKNLSDSNNMFELLCQGWENADDVDALKEMDATSTLEIPFRSFYFSADGSFIKNPRNSMEYGNWKYDDAAKTITLNYKSGADKDVYKIVALAPDELKLLNKGINTSTQLKFVSSAKQFINPLDEPFHTGNNKWRIKPERKESPADIRQRLKDNLHFFLLFYKDALAKNSPVVSFWGLPCCLDWYSGAIYLQKKENINEKWVDCFYNRDQAMIAYGIMDKVMDKKYKWSKDQKNWIEKNAEVLQQIYDNIDSVK